MTIEISEFEKLDGFWRIDWLGYIVPAHPFGSRLHVVVHLAELKSDFKDPLSNKSLCVPDKLVQVRVDVGLIALLKIGTVWHKGIRVESMLAPTCLNAHVCWDQFQIIKLNELYEVEGEKFEIISPSRHRICGGNLKGVSGSWLAVASGFDSDRNSHILAIPSAVLFQSAMATSPKAIRRLLFGEIDKIVDADWGFIEGEPDVFRINLFKDFRDSEGVAIANIKADPVAAEQYKMLRNALVVERANEVGPNFGGYHIRMGMPFSNEVSLRAGGKNIAFKMNSGHRERTIWGFLVTEIYSLEAQLVFSRLVIDRKNDASRGANADDPTLEESWPVVRKESSFSSGLQLKITSQVDPGHHLENVGLEASGLFKAIGLEILDREKDLQRYRSVKLIRPNGDSFEGAASAGDAGGLRGVAPVDIDASKENAVPVTLQHLFDALDILASDGLMFKTLVVSSIFQRRLRDGQVVNFLRPLNNYRRSWRRMTVDLRGPTRGFVVAEAYSGGVWHYVVDIEHKRPGELSMTYVRSENGCRIEAKQFDYLLEKVAKANGWRGLDQFQSIWRFKAIPHAPQRGKESLARSIRSAIR